MNLTHTEHFSVDTRQPGKYVSKQVDSSLPLSDTFQPFG